MYTPFCPDIDAVVDGMWPSIDERSAVSEAAARERAARERAARERAAREAAAREAAEEAMRLGVSVSEIRHIYSIRQEIDDYRQKKSRDNFVEMHKIYLLSILRDKLDTCPNCASNLAKCYLQDPEFVRGIVSEARRIGERIANIQVTREKQPCCQATEIYTNSYQQLLKPPKVCFGEYNGF